MYRESCTCLYTVYTVYLYRVAYRVCVPCTLSIMYRVRTVYRIPVPRTRVHRIPCTVNHTREPSMVTVSRKSAQFYLPVHVAQVQMCNPYLLSSFILAVAPAGYCCETSLSKCAGPDRRFPQPVCDCREEQHQTTARSCGTGWVSGALHGACRLLRSGLALSASPATQEF